MRRRGEGSRSGAGGLCPRWASCSPTADVSASERTGLKTNPDCTVWQKARLEIYCVVATLKNAAGRVCGIEGGIGKVVRMSATSDEQKVGHRAFCPVCNDVTVVKLATRYDGWTEVGRYAVCALCGQELESAKSSCDTSGGETEPARGCGDQSLERAAQFLGENVVPGPTARDILRDGSDAVFCKDCRFFCRHPFVDMCLRHERPVASMHDCPDFECDPQSETESGGND